MLIIDLNTIYFFYIKGSFQIGDYVFGKVKGYCFWPGRIRGFKQPNETLLYLVKFYGTSDW